MGNTVPESLRPRYIAIEGIIGVGKTTLASILAEAFDGRTLLEEFEDNPFLREFYLDPRRVAFQTQVYFLMARYKQQEELPQQDLFSRVVVSDYLFAKDRIFAYLNLSEPELQLYERIYALLRPALLKPDLVIFLQARPEVVIQRLRKRGRDMETSIQMAYLEELSRAYNSFFAHYDETPLLTVETSNLDYVQDPDARRRLTAKIETIRAGSHRYEP